MAVLCKILNFYSSFRNGNKKMNGNKNFSIIINDNRYIPFLNKRGPINYPITVSEQVKDSLVSQGFNITVLATKTDPKFSPITKTIRTDKAPEANGEKEKVNGEEANKPAEPAKDEENKEQVAEPDKSAEEQNSDAEPVKQDSDNEESAASADDEDAAVDTQDEQEAQNDAEEKKDDEDDEDKKPQQTFGGNRKNRHNRR